MSITRSLMGVVLVTTLFAGTVHADDQHLSLADAVEAAHQSPDPSISGLQERARSSRFNAIAEAELPDPMARIGVTNLPVDDFSLDREAMTQMQIGVRQQFTSGAKRRAARAEGEAMGEAFDAMAATRKLMISQTVRRSWLKILGLENMRSLVSERQATLREMLAALESRLATGTMSSQRLLSMEAELALLQDRINELEQHINVARTELARYVGEDLAGQPLEGNYRSLSMPTLLAELEAGLINHPAIANGDARIRAVGAAIKQAEQAYKPEFALDLSYGRRGAGRSDMGSVMVTFNLPLFTGKRQDKRLEASKRSRQAARLERQTVLLDMTRNLRARHAVWQQTAERIELYERVLLDRTQAASQASESAFSAGSGDFGEIIRTQIAELDARLKLEAIRLERAQAQADLIYFQGDTQ